MITQIHRQGAFHYTTGLIKNSNNFSHNFASVLGLQAMVILESQEKSGVIYSQNPYFIIAFFCQKNSTFSYFLTIKL